MAGLDDGYPEQIVVSKDRRHIRLVWATGREDALDAPRLRSACRCAWCTRGRLTSRFTPATDDTLIATVDALAGHGLHITFSDGHARGIFPWAYLSALAAGGDLFACSPHHNAIADAPVATF